MSEGSQRTDDIHPSAPDPITSEIIIHHLCAIPNIIDKNITRTAYSLLISEYKDFAVGIVDAEARLVSQCKGGLPVFVANALSAAVRDGLRHYGTSGLQTGDVMMTNAPATMGQHLNNVALYTPIRRSGDDSGLLGFFVIVMHWMDIGGYSVGSCCSTKTTDIFQEGIQFPTMKLVARGERVADVYRLVEANTRFPRLVLGDLEAQVAGCMMGRDMVLEVVDKFGREAVLHAIEAFWRRAETAMRDAIREIPDGTYEASSFLDDDGMNREKPLAVDVVVRVEGDQLTVDLKGLARQVTGPWNAGYEGGAVAAVRIACKLFFASDDPANEGAFRPVRTVCPPGTFMSAHPTAALAGSGHNLPTVVDTILLALGKACPTRAQAAHHGTYASQIIVGRTADGDGWFQSIGGGAGGWGASHDADGAGPFRSVAHGDTPDVPAEVQEATYPYRLQSYALRVDSGGAGRFRGGLGIEKVFKILTPVDYTVMMERTRCPPWGLAGGRDGKPGRVEIRRDGVVIARLSKDDMNLMPGDEIHVLTAGGGGYGDPRMRPVDEVIDDVRNGYVSAASAVTEYGVDMN